MLATLYENSFTVQYLFESASEFP